MAFKPIGTEVWKLWDLGVPLQRPGCEGGLEDRRVKGASKLYLRIKGVFKELRGFRILGYWNLRILGSCNLRIVGTKDPKPSSITIEWGCMLPVWEPLVAPLGAPNRSIALHLASNISQDSSSCSQDLPRQPNLDSTWPSWSDFLRFGFHSGPQIFKTLSKTKVFKVC